ncbi:MAG: GNAT family N-acetyltransferase [Chloroflexi bacterium]|nr:GNAT family N-acetyltransferase [Chloroflexota bacterium]
MTGSVLQVRRLERCDLEARTAWFNDPIVAANMLMDYPASLADTEKWFADTRLDRRRRDFSLWVQRSGEICAMAGLTDVDERNRRAEMYVVVAPNMRRQGIGATAVAWITNYGFAEMSLDRVYLFTLRQNHNAQSLYRRLGFCEEGVLRRHVLHRGTRHDRLVFGLLKDEWSGLPWAHDAPLPMEIRV